MIRERGEILVVVIAALGVVLFSVLFIIAGAQLYYQNSKYSGDREKATLLAEAGVDKAITALNKTGGAYFGETETSLSEGSYSVIVTVKDVATKTIESTGYVPNKENTKVKRIVKITASRGIGAAFVYGIQVGEGGLRLGNSNIVTGSVYSNGNILAGNNNSISGDAWVAGGPQPNPDQQTDCEAANCSDFIFGKNVDGEERLDVTQSFQPSTSALLNRVSIKIKKSGNPPDLTVRILRDDDGKPDKHGVLTTGTLYSSLVTSNYGFIDIGFSSSPQLLANTTYWIMLDTSSNATNFWSWQNDLGQSYTRGQPTWSSNWSIGNPTWNSFSGDLSFKTFMGGTITSIRANNDLRVNGDVHANTIENLTIGRDAYYQTRINSTVGRTSFPGSADPPPKVFPISEANIAEWKQQAETAGISQGDITTCPTTIDSKKIVGNVSFGSNCTITVKSPIWITGNLTLGSNIILRLDSSYGASSGVIVVDGRVVINSNNNLQGSGVGSSLLMVLSNYDSRTNDIPAIQVNSQGNTGVYYAQNGIIEPGTNNTFKELTAWGIRLVNNSTINYETGLSSTLFTSGPTGGYTLVKGTYQIK